MDRRVEGETAGDCQAEAAAEVMPTNLPARLPEDVFADILRRLAPRDLAASRCVRKAWRDVVDGRRLLRTELLPLWVGGIFVNFHNYYISELFSSPSASRPAISGKHDYLPGASHTSWSKVCDHCNGLLLVEGWEDELDCSTNYVLNPATRWCAPLPPLSTQDANMHFMDPYREIYDKYLVHDPTVSPHYKVFLIPRLGGKAKPSDLHYDEYIAKIDPAIEQSEWPPSPCILQVFSSRTGQWKERSFVREGEAAGTIADIRVDWPYNERHAVYWRGALYIHCQTDFVMRISLSNSKYRVIKHPVGLDVRYYHKIYLGKSKNGVYCANLDGWFHLRVWILKESSSQIEWVLKHETDLSGCLSKYNHGSCYDYRRQGRGPWVLQNINCHYTRVRIMIMWDTWWMTSLSGAQRSQMMRTLHWTMTMKIQKQNSIMNILEFLDFIHSRRLFS